MKKIQGFLTCVAVFAASVSMADGASQANGVTPFGNLKLSNPKGAFVAEAGLAPDNCSLVTNNVAVESGYLVLEGNITDETAPLTVTQNNAATNVIEKFCAEFKASFVEYDELTNSVMPAAAGAKIGFALTGASKAAWYNGSKWGELEGLGDYTLAEEAACKLTIDYDAREAALARFTLFTNTTVQVFTSRWVTVGQVLSNSVSVVGAGQVKSLGGATYTVEAEEIIVTPPSGGTVKIELSPKQMKAMATIKGVDPADPATVSEALFKENTTNGQCEIANLALFGKAGTQVTAADKPRSEGITKTTAANKIGVKIGNINPQTVTGTTVKYRLMAWRGTEWVRVGEDQLENSFEFNADTTDRKFKVQAVIEYQTVND